MSTTTTDRNVWLVKKDHPDAQLPLGHFGSVGFDVFAYHDCVIPGNNGRVMVSTGVSMTVPVDSYARIAPRSSLAKHGIDTLAGVIDRDFTGTVMVMLVNLSDAPYAIRKGDRIAQVILERVVEDVRMVSVEALTDTVRGGGMLGSTGV